MHRIESLLSARLFLTPQLVEDRLYFISNLSGRLSLYAMNYGGSVPEPLLPPEIALQNPHLLTGESFFVFPRLGKILVMIDKDGDEVYQPMLIPLEGGYPEPAFAGRCSGYRVHLGYCDPDANLAYLNAESLTEQKHDAFRGNLETGELLKMGESKWGCYADGCSADHRQAILIDGYSVADNVLYLWRQGQAGRELLYGVPLESRPPGMQVPLNAIQDSHFTAGGGLLFFTALFSDSYGLGYFRLENPKDLQPVAVTGVRHSGTGELSRLLHLKDDRYLLLYNIDGCSWLYEGTFDEGERRMQLHAVICGQGEISSGVLESVHYDPAGDRFALSFSTATSPTQIFTVESESRSKVVRHTNERILGIPQNLLSPGEDASFTSFDGQRVSARLYLPAPALGFTGPRPLVYYVHGGPQSQERPDFAWFSMPLIQFLTLKGFAVFVPNVRGSTGYGLSYTKQVDRDWGGKDRLDHVHAMTEVLPKDGRLDVSRAGVVGRSYGGYMSLTLASRHPQLWRAAIDMFGPYNLISFSQRIPETWKPYFSIALGDPETDREFLVERSPNTYLKEIACPLLVIQGKNDPRVIEQESRDVVEDLRARGKEVEYLVFQNEGHDVLKFENRVACYNAITEFFQKHLSPGT